MSRSLAKVPAVTLGFWAIKILATTLSETAGDTVSMSWLIAYNFAKQLKAPKFRTPYQAIEELWKSKPDIFIVKPNHHILGSNT